MNKGFSSEQKLGNQKYGTLQPIGSGRHASDSVIKVLALIQVADYTPEVGSTQSSIQITGHSFRVGDAVKFTAGPNAGVELHIIRVDTNNIYFGHKVALDLAPTDTFQGYRPVSLSGDSDGNLVTSSGPVQIVKDSVVTTINKDTVTANNTVGMPVEIVGTDGAEINITAGDINVQLSHTGANPDSTRIGDGVTELGIIPVTKEAKVSDADTHTKLDSLLVDSASIDTKLDSLATEATAATLATEATAAAILAKIIAAPATEATLATLATEATAATLGTETTLAAILAKIIAAPATEAKQDDIITAIQAGQVVVNKEVHESIYVASQALTTAGLVTVGAAIPNLQEIVEIEVAYKDGATLRVLFNGVSVGMVTQGGGKLPLNIVGDGVKQLQLQAVGADVTVADLMVNIIK